MVRYNHDHQNDNNCCSTKCAISFSITNVMCVRTVGSKYKVENLPVHKEDGGDGGNEDEPEP